MNILFVSSVDDVYSPRKPLRSPEQIQFGISYISSFLKKHGHNTGLIVLSRLFGRKNKRLIEDYVRRKNPKLICFTAVSTEYKFIRNIARCVKESHPDIYLLIGGPHASLNPDEVIQDSFNALCIGEGEHPTLEAANKLDKEEIPSGILNLWVKNKRGIEKNPTRPLINDLDNLPFPDRLMWREWLDEEESSREPVLLGRGCPFECTYCCNHALRKLAPGRYVRFRSTENILTEIKEIVNKFPEKKSIYLEVETIGADKAWALELCDKLEKFNRERKKPVSFGVNLRITPNIDFERLFSAFKKSNFDIVNIGIESGSERIRREVLKRNYSNGDVMRVVNLARKYALKVYFYNLLGIPGETPEDFKKTLEINRICQPDRAYNHIFFPYPGTKLYSVCKKEGLLPEKISTELERCKAVLDLPKFRKKDIQKNFIWFDYNVFKGYKPLTQILRKVLVSMCRSNTMLHYFYRKLTYLRFFM